MSHRAVLTAALFAICAASSCSTRNVDRTEARSSAPRAVTVARAIPLAGARVAAARPLNPSPLGFAAASVARDPARALSVRLPRSAAGALWVERSPMVWIEATAERVLDVPGSESAGVVTYAAVDTDTDTLQFFDGAVAEELRVLHSERAPHTFSWRLRLGPAIERVEVIEGVVQALDVEGRARLRATPMVSWDSAGHARALDVQVAALGNGEARLTARLDTTGLTYPIVVDPAWGSVSNMAQPRWRHAVVRLGSGKHLVIGGSNPSSSVVHSTAELFDPATLGWTLVGAMSLERNWHAASLLASGKVLVAGGRGPSGQTRSTAELFDPATNTFTDTTPPPTSYAAYLSLVTLGDKTLMAANSNSATPTNQAWVYTESTGTWAVVSNTLSSARSKATAIALDSNRAWIVGQGQATDFWDATTGLFSPGPTLNFARGDYPGVVRLSSGRVLVVGGSRSDAELYDPSTGLSLVTGIPSTHAGSNMLAALPGDRAIFSGGTLASSIFEGVSKAWTAGPNSAFLRTGGAVSAFSDGRVLVAGGSVTSGTGVEAEIFGDLVTLGATCSSSGQCASGFCSFGVCCNRACDGACESCSETGSVGTCTIVSGAPRPGHGSCGGTGVCAGTCDGTAATCTTPGTGTACVKATCAGGVEQPAAYCSGTGSCGATPATKACAPFLCGATACKTTCATDADCVSTAFCNTTSSLCEPKRADGGACKAATDCTSGHCALDGTGSGVCCDRACNGGCETCAASGGVGTCQLLAKDTPCGADACSGSTLTKAALCDGASGACPAPAPTACPGSLVCADGKSCKTACATGSDCTTGYCDLSTATCAAMPGDSGVDAGAIAEAGAPTLPEKPTVAAIQRCVKGSECATGFCVDGVCCDTACADRCHSCALLSSPGKCTVEPIGVDLRSECGPANQCLGTCDGSGTCIGAGAGTMCGRNRCTGPSTGVGPAYCSAPGAKCPAEDAVPFDCAPYACEPAFGACLSTCASSNDCAHDFVCDTGSKTCVPMPAPTVEDEGCHLGRAPIGASGTTLLALSVLACARRRRRVC